MRVPARAHRPCPCPLSEQRSRGRQTRPENGDCCPSAGPQPRAGRARQSLCGVLRSRVPGLSTAACNRSSLSRGGCGDPSPPRRPAGVSSSPTVQVVAVVRLAHRAVRCHSVRWRGGPVRGREGEGLAGCPAAPGRVSCTRVPWAAIRRRRRVSQTELFSCTAWHILGNSNESRPGGTLRSAC